MAKYDQLPIYRKGLELIVFLEKAVRQFSRYHKYSIGERLRQTSWNVVTLVVKSNNTPVSERRELLVSLRDKIEEVNIALTVAKELEAFSNHNSWQQAARMAVGGPGQTERGVAQEHKAAFPRLNYSRSCKGEVVSVRIGSRLYPGSPCGMIRNPPYPNGDRRGMPIPGTRAGRRRPWRTTTTTRGTSNSTTATSTTTTSTTTNTFVVSGSGVPRT